MSDVRIRVEGRAGRITLDRPDALNALTHDMVRRIDAALAGWADDPAVALVLIDGAPGRAFCAGGDLVSMYRAGRDGTPEVGRAFWRAEYRMNARIACYPKPVVSFLHGFVMGGGVGVGCHASHRIVDATSRVAMPECAVGLVPDVGGSRLLAHAPGRLGTFLAVTGHRMGAGDAIRAGFADHYVMEGWDTLTAALCADGDADAVAQAAGDPPVAPLTAWRAEVDRLCAGPRLGDIARAVEGADGPAAEALRDALARNSPLSMACAVEILRRLGPDPTIGEALALEHRFTHRALVDADFVEGIRAAIVDKDRAPRWRHADPTAVPDAAVKAMLAPVDGAPLDLGADAGGG